MESTSAICLGPLRFIRGGLLLFFVVLMARTKVASAVPTMHGDSNELDFDDSDFMDTMRESSGDNSIGHSHHGGSGGKSLEPATTYSKPIVPLTFRERAKKRPRGRNLKASRLLKKMGNDFNPNWMSVSRPIGGTYNVKVSLPETTVAELMEQISDLDIETDIREMLSEDGDYLSRHDQTVSRAVGAFQQWLVKKSACPVQFQWSDLGEYFWPRYVRQGECQNKRNGDSPAGHSSVGTSDDGTTSSDSCSWPRGMSCNPADAQVLQILRWHCSRRKTPDLLGLTVRQKIRRTYKCRWIKIPYPVTSSCRCE